MISSLTIMSAPSTQRTKQPVQFPLQPFQARGPCRLYGKRLLLKVASMIWSGANRIRYSLKKLDIWSQTTRIPLCCRAGPRKGTVASIQTRCFRQFTHSSRCAVGMFKRHCERHGQNKKGTKQHPGANIFAGHLYFVIVCLSIFCDRRLLHEKHWKTIEIKH